MKHKFENNIATKIDEYGANSRLLIAILDRD